MKVIWGGQNLKDTHLDRAGCRDRCNACGGVGSAAEIELFKTEGFSLRSFVTEARRSGRLLQQANSNVLGLGLGFEASRKYASDTRFVRGEIRVCEAFACPNWYCFRQLRHGLEIVELRNAL